MRNLDKNEGIVVANDLLIYSKRLIHCADTF